jgi:hypothetical protein
MSLLPDPSTTSRLNERGLSFAWGSTGNFYRGGWIAEGIC